MKQFEKWFEETNKCCEIENNICDKVGNCDACKSLQKIGWKAAFGEIIKDIREELKSE